VEKPARCQLFVSAGKVVDLSRGIFALFLTLIEVIWQSKNLLMRH